ncbi:MAG TPA: glycerophosphodiester phosphodiesterase family protein, partial [Arthrobacter sp.]|nr:glycerophosphodiester phosphodiesterase family protein [Arthrobacter sp.]
RGVDALQVPVRYGAVTVVTPDFVRRAHRHGLQVHVWTVNDPAEMHRLLDLGVDGIVTDRADLLKEVLQERGGWSG